MKKLYRSEDNKILGGVLGGVAEYYTIDPVIIRLLAVLIAVVTGIVPFALVYLLGVIAIPKQNQAEVERGEMYQ